ncbi:hypothetical protein JW758_03295 [Candidatus Peregrinibacteria bacterium]|nr:hypothetical protein [Candidatus Peregrinibacteria bacterium]
MKKLLILSLAFTFAISLSGCNKGNTTTTSNNDAAKNNEELNCFTLCHDTIVEKCEDQIVEMEANDIPVMTSDTIYNSEFCQTECMANWTPEIMQCVHNAKSCDQIGPTAEFCITNPPEDPFEYPEETAENKNCSKACKNYADCAGFGTDATPADLLEAYNSCYGECQGWSEKTIKCMSDADGNSANGCIKISMCGLGEYQQMINTVQ